MKNKIFGAIWILIAALLLSLLIIVVGKKGVTRNMFGIKLNNFTIENTFHNNLYDTQIFDVEAISNLDIKLKAESLSIEKAIDNKITVELYCKEKTAPLVYVYQNILKIEQKKTIFGPGNRKVIIKLPATFEPGDVDINVSSGAVRISDATFPALDLHTSSGSLKIVNCKFGASDIKVTSGSISINDSEIDDLDCNSTSGSIHITGSLDQFEINAVSGSIHVDLDTPFLRESEIHATSGSVHLTLPAEQTATVKYSVTSGAYKNDFTNTNGKQGTDYMGSNGPSLELHTTSGSVKVNRK